MPPHTCVFSHANTHTYIETPTQNHYYYYAARACVFTVMQTPTCWDTHTQSPFLFLSCPCTHMHSHTNAHSHHYSYYCNAHACIFTVTPKYTCWDTHTQSSSLSSCPRMHTHSHAHTKMPTHNHLLQMARPWMWLVAPLSSADGCPPPWHRPCWPVAVPAHGRWWSHSPPTLSAPRCHPGWTPRLWAGCGGGGGHPRSAALWGQSDPTQVEPGSLLGHLSQPLPSDDRRSALKGQNWNLSVGGRRRCDWSWNWQELQTGCWCGRSDWRRVGAARSRACWSLQRRCAPAGWTGFALGPLPAGACSPGSCFRSGKFHHHSPTAVAQKRLFKEVDDKVGRCYTCSKCCGSHLNADVKLQMLLQPLR